MIAGGVPFLSPSSRASSAGWTIRSAVHGSDERFSSPRIPGTEMRVDRTSKTVRAKTKEIVWKRLVAVAKDFLREASRLLNKRICESMEIAAYFLSSARVRWSFMAVVRRVSGTFLLEVRR